MANKKWTHLKLKNGDLVQFVPPAPDGDFLGGMSVAEKRKLNGIEANADVTDAANVKSAGAVMGVQAAGTALTPDENGKVNIPTASNTLGLVKTYSNAWSGVYVDPATGELNIASAANTNIDNRNTNYKPIVPNNLNYAVKAALTDANRIGTEATNPTTLTDADKTNAWSVFANIKTAMSSPAVAGAQYYLGTQSAVSINLPTTALVGQRISVIFYSAATATTLSVSGNTVGNIPIPLANQRVEMSFLWDGVHWAIATNVMGVD